MYVNVVIDLSNIVQVIATVVAGNTKLEKVIWDTPGAVNVDLTQMERVAIAEVKPGSAPTVYQKVGPTLLTGSNMFCPTQSARAMVG